MIGTRLGSTSRNSSRDVRAPMQRAAVTNSRSRNRRVCARTMRATVRVARIVTATTTLRVFCSRTVTMNRARISAGRASRTLITPLSTMSTHPPKKPASSPIRPPIRIPSTTASTAIMSDSRPPHTTLANMSRPNSSVPNQCDQPTPCSTSRE